MSWTDDEIDKLYQTSAEGAQFDYKAEYWREMEAMLPIQEKKGDALWFFFSAVIFGLLLTSVFVQEPIELGDGNTTLVAKNETSDNVMLNEVENKNEEPLTDERVQANDVTPSAPASIASTNYSNASSASFASETKPAFKTDKTQTKSEAITFEEKVIHTAKEEFSSTEVDGLKTRTIDFLSQNELQTQSHPWDQVKLNTAPLSGMFVQLLGGASQSMVDPSTGWSNSFGAGFGYSFQKGKFVMNAGLNGVISNHNDLELTRSAKVYGFGSEVYTYNIDYQQLYLIEGNLEFGYLLGRHELKAGVRPSYVFSSRVRVSETAVADQSLMSEEHGSYYGYMDGLKRFGLKPTFGYAFRISPDLQIGLNVGVQLLNGVNEDFVEGVNNNLPIDGQLYLRKTIRFRK